MRQTSEKNGQRGPWVMRFPTDVLERTADLSPRAFRVLIAIESFCRMDWICWPSNATLAKEAGVGMTQVRSCLAELEDAGWIGPVYSGRCIEGSSKTWTRQGIIMRRRLDPDLSAAPDNWEDYFLRPPAGVDAEMWRDYLDNRAELGKPVKTL